MFDRNEILEKWIPYRLQAIETFRFAWELVDSYPESGRTQIVVNGATVRAGNIAMVANPMIEAGAVHARALLEFLGLCARGGQLGQVKDRKRGDIGVENFSTVKRPIFKVNPDEAIAAYAGPAPEAEASLVAIFELANRTLAHVTNGTFSQQWTDAHIDIACRGIPVLIHNHLYAKLGRDIPPPPEGRTA